MWPPCDKSNLLFGPEKLDEQLELLADAAGVTVGALDDHVEQALAFLMNASEERQLEFLRLSLAGVWAGDDDGAVTAIGTWVDEEPLILWEIARERAASLIGDSEAVAALFREVHDHLVVERNRIWLARILDHIREVRNIVIAVGGIYLPGEQGLLRLLEAEGFEIRRLAVS